QPDRAERSEHEGDRREDALSRAPDDHRGQESNQQERVEGAFLVGPLHVADGLERDDRRAGHVGVDRPQLADEPLGAVAVPDIDLGLDLEEEAAALPDELAPKLTRHVGEPNRGGMEISLQATEGPWA